MLNIMQNNVCGCGTTFQLKENKFVVEINVTEVLSNCEKSFSSITNQFLKLLKTLIVIF